ncbi:hypothetical protein FEM48_Zijuj05G0106400 [Ziziphus jujuba var. spinosa]|uniref:Uncharacterized protein n=1 Tax=Ziziphus jujuba var. spinosa TaxID=714518 RepID=A0A978VEH1_ZIZJJ|nr:hypothetical protein FEM48_Zijuj05G0106400 [Ziziphus jujuba var. spinosa]
MSPTSWVEKKLDMLRIHKGNDLLLRGTSLASRNSSAVPLFLCVHQDIDFGADFRYNNCSDIDIDDMESMVLNLKKKKLKVFTRKSASKASSRRVRADYRKLSTKASKKLNAWLSFYM